MANHPNRNRALTTEVGGVRFKLSLDALGRPPHPEAVATGRRWMLALGNRLDCVPKRRTHWSNSDRLASTGWKASADPMGDAAMSEPTRKSYHLSLGRADRSMTDQGKGEKTIDPYTVAHRGARWSIVFDACKLARRHRN